MTSSNAASADHRRAAPSSRTASASPPGSRPATRSPSRWEQLIPAACMNVASPSSSAQSASHVARSREVSSRGSPPPPSSAADQRVREVPAARLGPAADQRVPGEPRPRPAAGRGSGPAPAPRGPRRRARARRRRRTGGPRRLPRTSRRSPRISPAPAPRQTSPAARIRRSARGLRVRQRQEPGDLRRAVGRLGPLPGQRQVRRVELRHHPAADEPQVRAQRAARHARQPRRAPGEPLGGRRVQQHLRHRLQAQPDRRSQRACPPPTAGSSPAPAPPAPSSRSRPGRTPPPAATPTTAATARYRRQPQHSPHPYSTYT